MKEYLINSDEVWHAGDIGNVEVLEKIRSWNPNIKAVYGNIDGHIIRNECPEFQFIEFGKHRILIIHIAGSLGKYNKRTRSLINAYNPTILVCGHSHILKVKKDHSFNLLYMNPGACGHHGFHKFRTLLQFQLTESKMKHLNAIELGKRGRK